MSSNPRVVVTVLNYNRADDTIECVNSLLKADYPSMEIVLVDNCSTDGSFERLKSAFPDLEVILTGWNSGYTGGVNVSITHARKKNPDYILVLNNDTEVDPKFLDHLVNAMEAQPDAAAASGTIYCHHHKTTVWYAGGRLIPWRGLAVHNNKGARFDPATLNGVQKVSFVSGCMILFRASMMDAVGLEDERFFLYLDDIELSARILRKGFDLLYVARAIIYHKVAGEDESPFKLYYSVRNRLLLAREGFGGLVGAIAAAYFLAVITCKLLVWKIRRPPFYTAAKAGLVDYFNDRFGEGRGLLMSEQKPR